MPVSDLAIYSYQPIVGEILIAKISKSDAFPRFISTQSYHDIVDIARANAPKVFLIDCGKPDRGLDLIRNILKVSPETKVVIFTGIESSEHAVISLDSGAAGYISSACSKIDVVTALELVASGQTFVSPHIAALVIKRMRRVSDEDKRGADQRMSYREEQIARLLLKGQTNRAIADRLGLSEKTIKYYMTNLMQKFAARNRLELAMALPKAPQSVHHFQ